MRSIVGLTIVGYVAGQLNSELLNSDLASVVTPASDRDSADLAESADVFQLPDTLQRVKVEDIVIGPQVATKERLQDEMRKLLGSNVENMVESKTVVCHGDGSMTATFKLRSQLYLYNVFAGSCNITHTEQPDGSYLVEYNPFECGVDAAQIDSMKFSSYGSSIELGFDLALYDEAQKRQLVINAYKFDVSCVFDDVYQTDTNAAGYAGEIDFLRKDMGTFSGLDISFNISIYEDSTFAVRKDQFPTIAGSQVFYGISPFLGSGYEDATMTYAPTKCVFEAQNQNKDSYTMFSLDPADANENQCRNELISLDVGFDGVREWRMSHILFLFAGEGGKYNLKCDVVVCDRFAAEQTICSHAQDRCRKL